MKNVLTIPLKKEYFDQIKAGTKLEEYRLCTPYWKKRIEGRNYDSITFTCGYPKRGDSSRRLVMPWNGYRTKVIDHPHFGPSPVSVYAINLVHSQLKINKLSRLSASFSRKWKKAASEKKPDSDLVRSRYIRAMFRAEDFIGRLGAG